MSARRYKAGRYMEMSLWVSFLIRVWFRSWLIRYCWRWWSCHPPAPLLGFPCISPEARLSEVSQLGSCQKPNLTKIRGKKNERFVPVGKPKSDSWGEGGPVVVQGGAEIPAWVPAQELLDCAWDPIAGNQRGLKSGAVEARGGVGHPLVLCKRSLPCTTDVCGGASWRILRAHFEEKASMFGNYKWEAVPWVQCGDAAIWKEALIWSAAAAPAQKSCSVLAYIPSISSKPEHFAE